MSIRIATTEAEIAACYPVIRELRPHIAEEQFLSHIRSQESAGYRLAYVQEANGVVAVAGFRVGENLAWGRFLYVDDLVTLPAHRSKGYGAKLLSWLKEQAAKEGCEQMHLDSGIQRKEAHRFYEREGMTMASLHFVEKIAPNKAAPADVAASAAPRLSLVVGRQTLGVPMHIERLDHFILTVRDVDTTISFYQTALGMAPVTFGSGRRALVFGQSKINLHPANAPLAPHASHPVPGSADLCFVTTESPQLVIDHLRKCGITIEEGPVPRTGALGPITSVYFRDSDGNLIEVSSYRE